MRTCNSVYFGIHNSCHTGHVSKHGVGWKSDGDQTAQTPLTDTLVTCQTVAGNSKCSWGPLDKTLHREDKMDTKAQHSRIAKTRGLGNLVHLALKL